MIKHCKGCLNPSTRPNTFFNEKGFCPVCVYEESKAKQTVDWSLRKNEIIKIKEWGKKHSKSTHDCIVTVSGGKDSMRQAFYVRDELKMNPLLIACVYPPEQLHDRGASNLSNLIEHGFDCISVSLDPKKWKELMKHGFFEFGNWCRSTEMALYAIPVHLSIGYKIPLMFYGENPALTMGEKHGRLDGNAIGIQEGNTIKGGPSSLNFDYANNQDYNFYEYPNYDDIRNANIRIIYLGYYIEDWYGFKNAKLAKAQGLKFRHDKPENIGDLWGIGALDEEFTIINQFVKYYKYGFGRVTDQVCEAIHQKIMTRSEGLKLVRKFDGKCSPEYIKQFCHYLDISIEKFWEVIDKNINRNLFEKDNGKWKPKFNIQ